VEGGRTNSTCAILQVVDAVGDEAAAALKRWFGSVPMQRQVWSSLSPSCWLAHAARRSRAAHA
jgi:hypothetical protein